MKKWMLLLAATLLLALSLAGCGSKSSQTLNVYNWGEYISDGSEGSFDTIREFESWYEETYGEKITVNYTTFASNEDMYNKISSGAVSYDVIIPSDYMIARMADEGLLQPLNFENIPNYQYIDDNFKDLYLSLIHIFFQFYGKYFLIRSHGGFSGCNYARTSV